MTHEVNGSTPTQVTYTKVGRRAGGAKRLWLEGLRLRHIGFEPGARYTVVYDVAAGTLILELDTAGNRFVAGRRPAGKEIATPILDLASATITDFVGEAGRVRAELHAGRIVFSLHPADAAIAAREARTRANVAAGTVTEGTLCAGGGIATYGVEIGLGVEGLDATVEWVIDRERRYLEVATANNPAVRPSTTLFEAALEDVEPHLLRPCDILQMSLPCTGHSKAGKSKRHLQHAEEHPTDALAIIGALRIVEATQPSVIISENVTEAEGSATYALLSAYLVDAGYRLFGRVFDEGDAGTIERRKRWWMVAISEGLSDGFSLSHLPVSPRLYETLGEALEPIANDDPQWRTHDYLADKEVRDMAAGKGFTRQLVTDASTSVGTIGKSYWKRRSTEPMLTRADGLERLLTPVEHARVKGIPEFLVAGVCNTVAHEILGQSILMPHAVSLGAAVARQLRGLPVAEPSLMAPIMAPPEPMQACLMF